MKLEFRPLTQTGETAWNAFADSSPQAWMWHRLEYISAMETWGHSDISFAVFTEYSAEAPSAIVPLQIIPQRHIRGLYSWRWMQSQGGPAFADGLPDKTRRQLERSIINHLLELGRKHKSAYLDILMPPLAPSNRDGQQGGVNPLVHYPGVVNTVSQTWMLDLEKGQDSLWDGLEGRVRTEVRKAEKNQVTVRVGGGESDLDAYYQMHLETYGRTGAEAHPKEYFRRIVLDFVPQGRGLLLIAEQDGQPIAAETFGLYKQAAIYWTGAAREEALRLGANCLLQWTAIGWLCDNGFKYYEVGQAFPGAVSGKLKGLSDFKKSFGGRLHPQFRGRLDQRLWQSLVLRSVQEAMGIRAKSREISNMRANL